MGMRIPSMWCLQRLEVGWFEIRSRRKGSLGVSKAPSVLCHPGTQFSMFVEPFVPAGFWFEENLALRKPFVKKRIGNTTSLIKKLGWGPEDEHS